ncbi:head GIN domain-containing protein [Flavobacterium sp. j3]|uniref:Head GIN domain-containing protein n=1 Tax=Flavobacterium aureirubrum TaxID=3133147 RepID=A0ABU9N8H9_9FLAO
MKNGFSIIISIILFVSCSKPSDCIESTGASITKDFEVASFNAIYVHKGIEMQIRQGNEFKVQVTTGENLIDDISVEVINNELILRDNTTCNWVREFGQTKIFVTTPTVEFLEIHSRTERKISSNGILTYPILRLIAMDLEEGAGTNDFFIEVNNSQTVIENNNVSRFYISGLTNELLANFYDGNGRLLGENLQAKNIKVFHRGSNDMIVKPTESITGKMVSTGNIILKNVPPVVDVEELYQGRVIYP